MSTVMDYFPLQPLYDLVEDLEGTAAILGYGDQHENKRLLKSRAKYLKEKYSALIDVLLYGISVPMDAIIDAYDLVINSAEEEDAETKREKCREAFALLNLLPEDVDYGEEIYELIKKEVSNGEKDKNSLRRTSDKRRHKGQP